MILKRPNQAPGQLRIFEDLMISTFLQALRRGRRFDDIFKEKGLEIRFCRIYKKMLLQNDIDDLKTIRRKNELFGPDFQKWGQQLKIFWIFGYCLYVDLESF